MRPKLHPKTGPMQWLIVVCRCPSKKSKLHCVLMQMLFIGFVLRVLVGKRE